MIDNELIYKFQQNSIHSSDLYILILSFSPPSNSLVSQMDEHSTHFLFICRITKNFKSTFKRVRQGLLPIITGSGKANIGNLFRL